MTRPAAHQSEQSSSDDSPWVADDYDASPPVPPLDEIRAQLDAWVEELQQETLPETSAGHEIPDPFPPLTPEEATEAHIEFLKALSHEELLDAAVELHAERNTLFRRLGSLPDLSQLEVMRDRLCQAIADIEPLRARNQQLEAAVMSPDGTDEIDEAGDAGDEDYSEEDDDFEGDWEAQKNQWLHQLQDNAEPKSSSTSPTDQARSEQQTKLIRQLKTENQDLRRRLDQKTESEQLLDADELIRQERERLAELQQAWESKMRQAEVEVSRERAEITRNRKKLEEQERTLQALREQLKHGTSDGSGKWRGLLGLK